MENISVVRFINCKPYLIILEFRQPNSNNETHFSDYKQNKSSFYFIGIKVFA